MPIEQAIALHRRRILALKEVLASINLSHHDLTLEIGCGHGHYMAAYAEAHPDEHCLAIDIIQERLDKASRKTERAGLKNVVWLNAAAEDLLEALPPETRFTRKILVLFPDPWPKRRHWKNRLIQPAFLDRLAPLSAPGTLLCFRTDHASYFEAAQDMIGQHPKWQINPTLPWPFEQSTVFAAKAPSYQSLVAERTIDQ